MKRCIALFLLSMGCTGPLHSISYDADIKWDHDQEYICSFTVKDNHLNCKGQQRTVNQAFKEVLNLQDMECMVDGHVHYCSCNIGAIEVLWPAEENK